METTSSYNKNISTHSLKEIKPHKRPKNPQASANDQQSQIYPIGSIHKPKSDSNHRKCKFSNPKYSQNQNKGKES